MLKGIYALMALAALAVRCKSEATPDTSTPSPAQGNLPPAPPQPQVVADQQIMMADGEKRVWKLTAGTYRAELTAVPAGVSITWVAASCKNEKKVTQYSQTCALTQDGQVMVENPTLLGLGSATSVTLKLTRLPP